MKIDIRIGALVVLLLTSTAGAQELARPPALAPLGRKPDKTVLDADQDGRRLEVKFRHDSRVRLREGHLVSVHPDVVHPDVARIDRWLDSLGATRRRVFEQSEERLDELRLAGEARTGRPLHDLNLFFRIECATEGQAARVCDELNAYDVVESSYPLGQVEDPVVHLVPAACADTPNFGHRQGYRLAAPLGIDSDYGNTFSGGIGTGTILADVETGWTWDHEDIIHKALGNVIGLTPAIYPEDHGTAVLGELVGENNRRGVRGIVYDADVRMSSHRGSQNNMATAIAHALDAVGPGDFIILEIQCLGGPLGPYPCEFIDSIFAVVQLATANGIHVVAAAGNGSRNLDNVAYQGKFDRNVRDSGAILVGASDVSSLIPARFSNHGSRLDAHGWGGGVTTCGYGDLFNGGLQRTYTRMFAGTSSATPIVTGAAAVLNGIHRAVFGSNLDPLELRALLTATGTPQESGPNIGPRPNVRAAIAALGVPRIEVAGSVTAGDYYQVEVDGPPRGGFALYFSPALRSTPLYQPPSGYLLLDKPVQLLGYGRLDTNGEGTFTGKIPADAPPGTFGFLQARVVIEAARGRAAYTNYAELEVD